MLEQADKSSSVLQQEWQKQPSFKHQDHLQWAQDFLQQEAEETPHSAGGNS